MPTPTQSFLDKHHPNPARRRVYDSADPEAYNQDGTLRDGVSIRVGLADASSRSIAPTRSGEPLIIKTGLNLQKEFHRDGTPRRRKTRETDQFGREVANFEEEDAAMHDAALHRPGWRNVAHAGPGVVDAANFDARDAAYSAYLSDLQSAWMSPEQRAQHVADAARVTADTAACPSNMDPRDFAYQQRCLQDAEAWRTPPAPYAAPGVGLPTRAAPNMPKGAWGQAGLQARAGDPCMANDGNPGTLREKDGWLYCEIIKPGPTRSSAPANRSNDARTMDMSDEVRSAWEELQAETRDAWKTAP